MELNPVSDALRDHLKALLPPSAFPELTCDYLEEPRGRWFGGGGLLVAPETVDEVSDVIRAASTFRTAVIPYGGGTGLVGGQVSQDLPEPIILSLRRMSGVREVIPDENVVVVEAGAILADVQSTAHDAGRLFPLSYGSEGTARIGGALAVNSGGINVLRYGTARDLCLGLEAVLPDGSIYHGLRRLKKDNTGYDLRNLLIGSEGTLGIITAAALRLFPDPSMHATALLTVPGPQEALHLLSRTLRISGGMLSGFELLSGQGPQFMRETGIPSSVDLDPFPDWAVLIEIATAGMTDPREMMEQVFSEAFEAGEASDGLVAVSERQRSDIWRLREAIPEANRRIGAVASHDVSLPLSKIPEFLEEGARRIAKVAPVRINAFGHLGDGNLHYNCFPQPGEDRERYEGVRAAISLTVHDLVAEMGGSFSAEHGLGRLKTGDLLRYGDPAKIAAMRAIKAALDPKGIMNPGAVLPLDH